MSTATETETDVSQDAWIGNLESALADLYLSLSHAARREADRILSTYQIDPNELLERPGKRRSASITRRRAYYTSGFIARAASVAVRTAAKWIDLGEIQGFRLPGSSDRRVRHEDFVAWVCRNPGLGIELDELFGPDWDRPESEPAMPMPHERKI